MKNIQEIRTQFAEDFCSLVDAAISRMTSNNADMFFQALWRECADQHSGEPTIEEVSRIPDLVDKIIGFLIDGRADDWQTYATS